MVDEHYKTENCNMFTFLARRQMFSSQGNCLVYQSDVICVTRQIIEDHSYALCYCDFVSQTHFFAYS